ncbi:MAG: methylated-DNA--[Clostridia bacterium]|nr:methylated-DNA--[protein]-cysteine S-methyltransferase [Clostridia bacterium]
MAYYTKIPSPIGEITLYSADGRSLAGLWLDTQTPRMDAPERCDTLTVFSLASDWLTRYFAGEKPCADEIPLDFHGTAFQRKVWTELLTIPYGTTVTYGEIASHIGCRSAQAVGQAVGRNPVSVIAPCHRVVGAGGKLTGYTGGLDKKRALLAIEGIL